MADLEKVINGMKHCAELQSCFKCPYFEKNHKCQDTLNMEALELLEETRKLLDETKSYSEYVVKKGEKYLSKYADQKASWSYSVKEASWLPNAEIAKCFAETTHGKVIRVSFMEEAVYNARS